MDQKMFCYQCEQTAGCAGCTGNAGVCGKTAETSRLQDQLVGALVGLARAAEGVECPGDGMLPNGDRRTFYNTYKCEL